MSGDVRLTEAEWAWGWHEAGTDPDGEEVVAGWGHHTSQMLHRLPIDSQTFDMRESILWMLAELRRTAEAPAPTDAREALAELAERIGRAADSVTTRAASSVSLERVRLEGKAQGLRLAESYTDDATRLAAALSPTAPDAGCHCPPCPGRGNEGHGMTHCAECCFGSGVEADPDCPTHGAASDAGQRDLR